MNFLLNAAKKLEWLIFLANIFKILKEIFKELKKKNDFYERKQLKIQEEYLYSLASHAGRIWSQSDLIFLT